MTDMLTLVILTILGTAMWPVNRWAMRRGARPEAVGIGISAVAAVIAAAAALAMHKPLWCPAALALGAVAGVAYAVGYVLIIFYCLKIGPAGPTVLMNNLGMVWPMAVSMIWYSHGKSPSPVEWLGVACIATTLALTAVNRGRGGEALAIGARWVFWVMIGWVFSGISQGCQYLASQESPDGAFAYTVSLFCISLLILVVVSAVRRGGRQSKVELTGGLLTGVILGASLPLSVWLMTRVTPMIVLPVTVAGPVVLMLLIGHAILKERLNALGWLAGALGIAGIVLLSLALG